MMFDNENDDLMDRSETFTVQDALAALQVGGSQLIAPAVIFGFSDLLPSDLKLVRPVWQKLPEQQRIAIMERLADGSEADFALDYSVFAHAGYDDPSEGVRLAAIRAGWTDDSIETMNTLMTLVERDASDAVRSAAMSQLGQYIYLGEIDELDKAETAPAEDLAFALASDDGESLEVRRRALEAIAHSSSKNIANLIEEAYNHDSLLMRVSALNAMGNTCDEVWEGHVLQELEGNSAELVYEAATAAGNIGLKSAVSRLADLGYSDDEQIQEAAIWALGEIATEEAVTALQNLSDFAENEGDDELLEAIEEALGTAELMLDMEDMLDEGDYDDEDYDEDDDPRYRQ